MRIVQNGLHASPDLLIYGKFADFTLLNANKCLQAEQIVV